MGLATNDQPLARQSLSLQIMRLLFTTIILTILAQPVWGDTRFKFGEELSEKTCLEILESGQVFLSKSDGYYTYFVLRGQIYRFHFYEQDNWNLLDISCEAGIRIK